MALGRGSARVATAALCLLVMVLQCEVTQAATYVVGDDNGWTSNIGGWEKGKTFKAGDILVFNYQQGAHNVAVLNVEGYNKCSATPSDKVYTSGNDQITLVKGINNFICSFPGHCSAGMKLQISAS